jgi:hypothetical protein
VCACSFDDDLEALMSMTVQFEVFVFWRLQTFGFRALIMGQDLSGRCANKTGDMTLDSSIH